MVEVLGIPRERVHEVVDWYHADETLHAIAGIPRWSSSECARWVRRAEKLLWAGRIDDLLDHIRTLAVGRRAPDIKQHLAYFGRNRARMQYAAFEKAHIPCGSGAVESAIRRIINLRLKSNAKYWLVENAEHMLLLRSYLKAGRFDDLIAWSFAMVVPWWQCVHALSPLGCEASQDSTDELMIPPYSRVRVVERMANARSLA
jgi:hypothetical protein